MQYHSIRSFLVDIGDRLQEMKSEQPVSKTPSKAVTSGTLLNSGFQRSSYLDKLMHSGSEDFVDAVIRDAEYRYDNEEDIADYIYYYLAEAGYPLDEIDQILYYEGLG